MPQISRVIFGASLFLSVLIIGLVYIRAALPMINEFNATQGPFGTPVTVMTTVVPVIVGGLLLFSALYIVAGPVQEEKTVQRRRRGR